MRGQSLRMKWADVAAGDYLRREWNGETTYTEIKSVERIGKAWVVALADGTLSQSYARTARIFRSNGAQS